MVTDNRYDDRDSLIGADLRTKRLPEVW